MEMKILVSYGKDFYYNTNDVDVEELARDEIIGYFDSLIDANKAVDKFIEESKNYHLIDTLEHPFDDVDIMKTYRKEAKNGQYYCIDIYYSLVLQ